MTPKPVDPQSTTNPPGVCEDIGPAAGYFEDYPAPSTTTEKWVDREYVDMN